MAEVGAGFHRRIPQHPQLLFTAWGWICGSVCQERLGFTPCSDGNEEQDHLHPPGCFPPLLSGSSLGCPRDREVTNVCCQGAALSSSRSQCQPWAVPGSAGRAQSGQAATALPSLPGGKEPEAKPWWLLGLPSRAPCPGQRQSQGNDETLSSKAMLWSFHPAWSQDCTQSSPGGVSLDGAELQVHGDKGQQCLGSPGHLALRGRCGASTDCPGLGEAGACQGEIPALAPGIGSKRAEEGVVLQGRDTAHLAATLLGHSVLNPGVIIGPDLSTGIKKTQGCHT